MHVLLRPAFHQSADEHYVLWYQTRLGEQWTRGIQFNYRAILFLQRTGTERVCHCWSALFDASILDPNWYTSGNDHLLTQFASRDSVPSVEATPSSNHLSGSGSRSKDSFNTITRPTCGERAAWIETKVSVPMVVSDSRLCSLRALRCCFDLLHRCSGISVRWRKGSSVARLHYHWLFCLDHSHSTVESPFLGGVIHVPLSKTISRRSIHRGRRSHCWFHRVGWRCSSKVSGRIREEEGLGVVFIESLLDPRPIRCWPEHVWIPTARNVNDLAYNSSVIFAWRKSILGSSSGNYSCFCSFLAFSMRSVMPIETSTKLIESWTAYAINSWNMTVSIRTTTALEQRAKCTSLTIFDLSMVFGNGYRTHSCHGFKKWSGLILKRIKASYSLSIELIKWSASLDYGNFEWKTVGISRFFH